MTGFTDGVVLEAPVFWWPPLGEVSKYPIDPHQFFIAAVSDAAMPWPYVVKSEVDDPCGMPTVGLSRLGRSVWMTAEWSAMEDCEEQPFVKVWSPITAETVYLPVCTTVGLGSSGTTFEELLRIDVTRLAREGRIRLTHRAVPTNLCLPFSSADRLFDRSYRLAQQHLAYTLLHRVLKQVHASSLKHLKRAVRSADASSACVASLASPLASSSVAPSSFLFTGDTSSQKHLIELLQMSTPSLLPVGGAHVAAVALEARRLNFAEVLTLNEQEALETVDVALRPPPLHASSPKNTSAKFFLPCLLIMLENLHLLEAHANSLVAGVTHQLCMSLESFHEGRVPALIWSFAEDTKVVPMALLSRVNGQHIRLSTTASEDRNIYLLKRINLMQQQRSANTAISPTDPATTATTTAAVKALTEETAHWTVDRLVRLRDEELLKMCEAHTPPAVPSGQQATHSGKTVEEPVHAAYSHLYGMDDDIHKVEELVVWPLTHLSLLRELSIPCSKGVLICGPSGSGKTALLSGLVRRLQLPDARSIHVLSVDGLSLIEKEVGRSEKNIAQLFETARSLAPTALFIDNLDALAPPRGRTMAETNTTSDRTLSTLLTQMDGVSSQAGRVVVVVASAPSIHTLDPAVCRPGRLDVHVYLRYPPISASAAFMKQRLEQFAVHAQLRFRSGEEDAKNDEVTAEFVSGLVEACVATVAADNAVRKSDEYDKEACVDAKNVAETAVSPAEVCAVVREIMLYVAEQLSQNTSNNGKREKQMVWSGKVRQYMTEAFARLGTMR